MIRVPSQAGLVNILRSPKSKEILTNMVLDGGYTGINLDLRCFYVRKNNQLAYNRIVELGTPVISMPLDVFGIEYCDNYTIYLFQIFTEEEIELIDDMIRL